jgi:hypothetical protein
MGIGKRPKKNNDNDEEVYVTSKKSKIETEHFAPPPFPSSSSSSTKHPRNLTSIHKDLDPKGKHKWKRLIKILGITEPQKQNWGKDTELLIIFLLVLLMNTLHMILMSSKNLIMKSKT